MNNSKRVIILARVSTNRQETFNQIEELRKYCSNNNYTVVNEYTESISGKSNKRTAINKIISLASQKKFDLLLFWNLDRFSRHGILDTLRYFKILENYGVEIKSYTQPFLDTSNDYFRDLLLSIFSYFANFQLKRYSEDIKLGQKRAREQGKIIGRPKLPIEKIKAIKKLKMENLSNRKIALKLKINEKTVRNYVNKNN